MSYPDCNFSIFGLILDNIISIETGSYFDNIISIKNSNHLLINSTSHGNIKIYCAKYKAIFAVYQL